MKSRSMRSRGVGFDPGCPLAFPPAFGDELLPCPALMSRTGLASKESAQVFELTVSCRNLLGDLREEICLPRGAVAAWQEFHELRDGNIGKFFRFELVEPSTVNASFAEELGWRNVV